MTNWPEFNRTEQFMLLENGNRVYRAIITEEQYNQACAAIAWRQKAREIYPNIADYIDERLVPPQPTGEL